MAWPIGSHPLRLPYFLFDHHPRLPDPQRQHARAHSKLDLISKLGPRFFHQNDQQMFWSALKCGRKKGAPQKNESNNHNNSRAKTHMGLSRCAGEKLKAATPGILFCVSVFSACKFLSLFLIHFFFCGFFQRNPHRLCCGEGNNARRAHARTERETT